MLKSRAMNKEGYTIGFVPTILNILFESPLKAIQYYEQHMLDSIDNLKFINKDATISIMHVEIDANTGYITKLFDVSTHALTDVMKDNLVQAMNANAFVELLKQNFQNGSKPSSS